MNERISYILHKPWVIPTAVGVVSFAGGAVAGYIYAKRNTEQVVYEYEEHSDQLELNFDVSNLHSNSTPLSPSEIDSLRDSMIGEKHNPLTSGKFVIPEEVYISDTDEDDEDEYGDDPPVPRDPRPDPRDIIVNQDAVKVLEQAEADGVVMTTEEAVTVNIFATEGEGWDYVKELEARGPDKPYIIHRDEFFAEEMDYVQDTITFYEIDEIMADDNDAPVYNFKEVTGPLIWGHGSGDQNVVYIRNDKRKAEYEVLRHPGSFSQEVLGIEIEDNARIRDIKHSESPRKFRMD